jgi:hypothetical protein
MKFITKNLFYSKFCIGYKELYIGEAVNTKFLGIHIDNHLNKQNHIEEMIPKLSEACYTIGPYE